MTGNLEERLRDWVEIGGRALELRVARAFKDAGASQVNLSRRYTGTTTDEPREIDVLAAYHWAGVEKASCRLLVAVECKSGTKHPWVGFYDNWAHPRLEVFERSFVAKHGSFTALTEPLKALWTAVEPFAEPRVATHIVDGFAAEEHRKGRDSSADAVRQAISGGDGLWREYVASQEPGKYRADIIIAAVVTAAPLFTCRLDDEGHVQLEQVDRLTVWSPRHDGEPTRGFVMNETALPEFATQLRHCRDWAAGEDPYD